MTSADRLYAYRIRGVGKPIRWGEFLPALVELVERRLSKHAGRRMIDAARLAAARSFAQLNDWEVVTIRACLISEAWQPVEAVQNFTTPTGRALVVHTEREMTREDVAPQITLDELPASWFDPDLRAYALRGPA